MCGIVGIFTKSQNILPIGILGPALKELELRGPNDEGVWTGIDTSSQVQIALGHRRLSILDTSQAGHQPMVTKDNDIVIVYNGEVFNFKELRSELVVHGYKFVSESDTEVLLYAYKQWGAEFISRCNGMFAIAIYDRPKRKVLFYRDRIGIKPLYYGIQGNCFYFGSTVSAISSIHGFQKAVSSDATGAYFIQGYVPAPLSIYENIYKLLPGHFLELRLETFEYSIKPYWMITDYLENRSVSFEEAVDRMEWLIEDSIRLRMRSDVPLGAFLSGGVDSSLVVSILAKLCPNKVKTFSIGFAEKEYNEAPVAKRTSQHLGTEHNELILSSNDVKTIVPLFPTIYDEPFSDFSGLPTYLLSKFAREQVVVAMSGDGGDEVALGAYNNYIRANLWRDLQRIPAPLRKFLGHITKHAKFWKIDSLSYSLLANDFAEYAFFLKRRYDYRVHPGLLSTNNTYYELSQRLRNRIGQLNYADVGWTKSMSTLDFFDLLPDDFLTKVDRASMANSLEVRVPLLDYRIVEFSRSIPEGILLKEGYKSILRAILGKYVPKSIWDLPKSGFLLPLKHWFRDELYEYSKEVILDGSVSGYSAHVAERVIEEHKSGLHDYSVLIWSLMSFALWAKRA
jgi:asparagine synthase (glutamine-hydrolysing)